MYYKSHIITTKTTERESVMITQRRKIDQKTTLATVLQIILESTDALAKSESKDLIRFYWFSIVPWPLSMTVKWKWFLKNSGNHSENLLSMYIIISLTVKNLASIVTHYKWRQCAMDSTLPHC